MSVSFLQNWITLHTNTRVSIALISDFLTKLMKPPIRFFPETACIWHGLSSSSNFEAMSFNFPWIG
jgi:hypothetical protein